MDRFQHPPIPYFVFFPLSARGPTRRRKSTGLAELWGGWPIELDRPPNPPTALNPTIGAAERTLIGRGKNYRRHRCVSCRQRDAATHTARLQVGWYIILMASDGGGAEVVE